MPRDLKGIKDYGRPLCLLARALSNALGYFFKAFWEVGFGSAWNQQWILRDVRSGNEKKGMS